MRRSAVGGRRWERSMGRTSETKRAEPRNAMRSISVGRNLPPVEASEAAAIASSSRPQTSHAAPKGTTFRGKTRHKYLGRRRRRYAPRANLLRPSSARYFAMCRRMVWRCARRRIPNLNDPLSVLEGAILSPACGGWCFRKRFGTAGRQPATRRRSAWRIVWSESWKIRSSPPPTASLALGQAVADNRGYPQS